MEVDLPGAVQGTASFERVLQLRDGLWTLERTKPDFSPLSFWQRFEGRFADDGDTIDARWESSRDAGRSWELDFTLTHRRSR